MCIKTLLLMFVLFVVVVVVVVVGKLKCTCIQLYIYIIFLFPYHPKFDSMVVAGSGDEGFSIGVSIGSPKILKVQQCHSVGHWHTWRGSIPL